MSTPNWGTYQGQFSIGGQFPGLGSNVKYFASGEYLQTDGNIGAMQQHYSRKGLAKLTFQPSRLTKLSLTGNVINKDLEIYEHLFSKFNPQGNDRISTETTQGIVSWTHTLSNNAFYELRVQRYSRFFFDRVKEDPFLYQNLFYTSEEDFARSGDDPRFIRQEERLWQGKFDLTYQATANHNIKAGIDYNYFRIWRYYALLISDPTTTVAETIQFNPVNAAAYIQDKMEFKDLVVNIGIRLDYYDPATFDVKDKQNPLTGGTVPGEKRWTVSPRLGFAHPISDKASLHFSYGHFYQSPEFEKTSQNRGLSLVGFVTERLIGNGNLKPQLTRAFEVGWDQQLTDFLALTVTGFYKDIENLISSDFYPTARPQPAAYYVNQDFANSRGVEFNLRTRRYNHFASYFSYTLARAEGNSSDPTERIVALDLVPPEEPLKRLVILDWDRPHVFNFNFDFRYGKGEGPAIGSGHWLENFGVNLTGRFESGLPYTPTDSRGKPIAENNVARQPSIWQLDLRLDKLFAVTNMKLGVFAEIINLTNRSNVVFVYTDTGLPFDNTNQTYTPEGQRDPYNVAPQRNIRLGFELIY
jgi:outer membrane receptor protein involved in Fe transport